MILEVMQATGIRQSKHVCDLEHSDAIPKTARFTWKALMKASFPAYKARSAKIVKEDQIKLSTTCVSERKIFVIGSESSKTNPTCRFALVLIP